MRDWSGDGLPGREGRRVPILEDLHASLPTNPRPVAWVLLQAAEKSGRGFVARRVLSRTDPHAHPTHGDAHRFA